MTEYKKRNFCQNDEKNLGLLKPLKVLFCFVLVFLLQDKMLPVFSY